MDLPVQAMPPQVAVMSLHDEEASWQSQLGVLHQTDLRGVQVAANCLLQADCTSLQTVRPSERQEPQRPDLAQHAESWVLLLLAGRSLACAVLG